MENFTAYNPTKLHFGKDVITGLGKAVAEYGNKVLLVYGGGSIKKNGIYDQVMNQLNTAGTTVWEYKGIRPNPIIEDVDAAAELGRQHQVDVVLAVGGGSVIDSAKVISVMIPVDRPGWDFYKGHFKPRAAVPLIAVLTLAATGTEMNPFAVVQNNATKQKLGNGHELMYPRHSFLDPQYTFSVPRDYTAYGIADLTAHCLEVYFGAGEATLSDRFVFAILQEAIENGPRLLNRLNDYELRARIMYAATTALNRMTTYGRKDGGDWAVHGIGHVLSLLYDIPHGATLSIVYLAWLRLQKDRIPERIAFLGKNVFGVATAEETIKALESFFKTIECPISVSSYGIGADKKNDILEVMILNKVNGNHHELTAGDYSVLIDLFI
jgi:alcohol dehydrogenase YqhD (iron-dependent ADH family)